MIIGLGIDTVEVSRIKGSIKKYGKRFTGRFFSATEEEYCNSRANKYQSYAARFAVKEAIIKAFGKGDIFPAILKEIEVQNDSQGKPNARFTGKAAKIYKKSGARACHISITHTEETAVAVAVLEK